MRLNINVFELVKETGSYENAKDKAIEQINSNPNALYQLDISEGIVDEKIADILAGIIYNFDQQKCKPVIIGKINLSKEESDLIVKAYVKFCGKDVQAEGRETFSGEIINVKY